MGREQAIARFFFISILAFFLLYFSFGWLGVGHRFTIALLTASILWTAGLTSIMTFSLRRARREMVEDERDRGISYKATFIGSAAGYLALFIGITFIHSQYVMNGVFTLPIDVLYQMFAIILLVTGAVRELAVLAYYRLS